MLEKDVNKSNFGYVSITRNQKNRDLDPVEDILKTGYSQKSRIESSMNLTKEHSYHKKMNLPNKMYTNIVSNK